MKAHAVIVMPAARRDFSTLMHELTEKAGGRIAEKYARRIERGTERLQYFPHSGSPRPGLGDNVRIWVVRPYLMIYEVEEDVVYLLRILHGKRNITPDLLDD